MLRKRRNPKKCCPSNQTNGAKQLGCQTYYRPPHPIRDIPVIRGYFLYAGISGSSGGSRRLTTDSTDADLTQKAGIEELDFQGKDGLAASDLAGMLRFIDCRRKYWWFTLIPEALLPDQAPASRQNRTYRSVHYHGVVEVADGRLTTGGVVEHVIWMAVSIEIGCSH